MHLKIKVCICLFFLFCHTILFCSSIKMDIVFEYNDLMLKLTNTTAATTIIPNNTRGLPFITLVFDEELNTIPDKDWARWFDWVKLRDKGVEKTVELPWERFNHKFQSLGSMCFQLCLAGTLPPFQPKFDLSKDGTYYAICVMRSPKANITRTIQTSNLVVIEIKSKKIISFKNINRSAISSRVSSFLDKELEDIKNEDFSE